MATPAEVPRGAEINGLDRQTAVSAHIGSKRVFGALANRRC